MTTQSIRHAALATRAGPEGAAACHRDNDATVREAIWRRFDGDSWAAYDALPASVRERIQCHAYDAWSVNALILWRLFRRQTASSHRAERRLLRYLDECETLEREAFADAYQRQHSLPLPHMAAKATVMRRRMPAAEPAAPPAPPQRKARLKR